MADENEEGVIIMNDDMTMTVTRSIAMSGAAEGGLICIKGDYIGQMVPLPGDQVVVLGRDEAESTYALSDPQISRRHCEITYVSSANQYRIVDCSKNGTFFGKGEKMIPGREYFLNPGTDIFIGNKRNLYKLR